MFMSNNTLFKFKVETQQEVTGNCYKGSDMACQGGGWLCHLVCTPGRAETCWEVPAEKCGLIPAC